MKIVGRLPIEIDKLFVPEERIRALNIAHAEMIASNMAERGQMQPILVCKDGDRYRIVAGEHRFEGAKLLGWSKIDCSVLDGEVTDKELELYEIDENLFRNELTAIERDISLARRKELYEALYPETKKGKYERDDHKRQNVVYAFSKDAARKMGLNKRTIERSATRASRLHPEVIEALKTSPIGKNASEIEALSKMSPEDQVKIAGAIARGAKTLLNARKAVGLAPPTPDPVEHHYIKLGAAWARAPRAARERFLDTFLTGWRKAKLDVGEPEAAQEGDDARDAGDAA